jgi:predicted DNA-binding transcriptional regulator AlpA
MWNGKAFSCIIRRAGDQNTMRNAERRRQRLKIEDIGTALAECGFVALDEQAYVLGLSRSTAWTILRGMHKSSGLSAITINRMLTTGRLPPRVRLKLLEYIAEKMSGAYGDRTHRLKAFASRISPVHMHAALFQSPKPDAVHRADKQLLPGQHESLKVYENNAFGQSRGMRKQRRVAL